MNEPCEKYICFLINKVVYHFITYLIHRYSFFGNNISCSSVNCNYLCICQRSAKQMNQTNTETDF